MHKLFTIGFSYVLFVFCINGQINKKIQALFLGNSYTYYNNLPQLVANLAAANGDTLIFDSNTPGGQTLQGHFNDVISLSKINAQVWDYVILQAQSQEPSLAPSTVQLQTLPYALKLDSTIKNNNNCTLTIFYETWGRKFGDGSNCAGYPPVCTYIGMQNRLRASYKLFADATNGLMSPVGEAFRKSIALNPNLELYDPDQSHPSLEGSYLSACVFYKMLFHKSILNNIFLAGVSNTNASFLQQIAETTVNDSLATWNLGENIPYAPFQNTFISPLNYQFISASPSLNNKWYFGDGAFSNANNPSHQYANAQAYTVSHVVSDACKKDSTSMVVIASVTNNIDGLNKNKIITIYPNPASNEIVILTADNSYFDYSIYDNMGSLQIKGKESKTINIEILPAGIYYINLLQNKFIKRFRFVKQ
jgi:Secretion system C-terminal sorting domain/PKD domain